MTKDIWIEQGKYLVDTRKDDSKGAQFPIFFEVMIQNLHKCVDYSRLAEFREHGRVEGP